MNKKVLAIILVFGAVILLLMILWFGTVLTLGIFQANAPETFLCSSVSPDEKYTLEAYKTQPGATVDFSIKVYLKTDNKKKLIYNAYHEYEVELEWISNSQVSINGKTLDLSKNETFDWRKNH